MIVDSANGQDDIGREPLEAKSRRDLFQHMQAAIHGLTPRSDTNGAVITLAAGELSAADVHSVYDELDEKHHIDGTTLRIVEAPDGSLRVFLEPAQVMKGRPAHDSSTVSRRSAVTNAR